MAEGSRTGGQTDVQAKVTAYWNSHSGEYDKHPLSRLHEGELRGVWSTALREALPPPPADVLDVGTGTGFLALLMSDMGYRVTGIDLAEQMLARARAKSAGMAAPPTLQRGDAVEPPFPPQSFDAVTSRFLLWTLREPARALENWRGLLRPGGRLVAIDGVWRPQGWQPNNEAEPEWWAKCLACYSVDVRRGLPLADTRSIDPFVAIVEGAGYADVRVARLHEVERIEREHAGAEILRAIQPQYLISAAVPGERYGARLGARRGRV